MLTALGWRYPAGAEPPVIAGVRRLLDGWLGVGRIVTGMARQGYDLQLTRYDGRGWRATFYPEGLAHSVTAAVGSGWDREAWTAVQRAARETLVRRDGNAP
jgi:hypothetical protein